MRSILVTGSRDWDDFDTISNLLFEAYTELGESDEIVLISGGCPKGADAMAESVWKSMKFPLLVVPARWDQYGKSAGHVRNKVMVDYNPDIVLAFVKNKSPGASGTVRLARNAGLTVWLREA